ncbi:MAG: hypothetical protein WBE37_18370 [Bryobacteraceae bacterium]
MPTIKTVTVKLTEVQQPFLVFELFLHLVKIRPVAIVGDHNSLYLTFPAKYAKRVGNALADLVLEIFWVEPGMKVCPLIEGLTEVQDWARAKAEARVQGGK